MRQLLLFALIFSLTPLTGRSQLKPDTTYYSKKVKQVQGKILSNKTFVIADTNIAIIKGQVLDNESKGIQSEIFIKSLQSNYQGSYTSDEDGNYSFRFPGERCTLTFEQSGYGKFSIDTITLISGQIQEIIVSLGSRYVVQHYIRLPEKQLIINKKKRKRLTE
jgi:hypothetical protein